MREVFLRKIDNDDCPKTDNPVCDGDCITCEFFDGYDSYNEFKVAKCTCEN